jgi:hypothetical protein
MNGIYQAEVFNPETREVQQTLIRLKKPDPVLTCLERDIVDVVRANPGISYVKLTEMFPLTRDQINDQITAIERKGILFGENNGCVEIVKINGVYLE